MTKALIITGIGDDTEYLERATRHWEHDYDVEPVMHVFGWEGSVEGTDQRLAALREHFCDIGSAAIVGVSAGASAGAILAAEDSSIVYINVCGRLHEEGNNIYKFEKYKTRAPRFVETVRRAEALLDKIEPRKAQVYRARLDELVPARAAQMPGVRSTIVPMPTHRLGIYYALRWESRQIAEHIKSQS